MYGARCPADGCAAPARECSGDSESTGGVRSCATNEIYYKTSYLSDDHVSNAPIHLTSAITDDQTEAADFGLMDFV